jgi:hypothetical protein
LHTSTGRIFGIVGTSPSNSGALYEIMPNTQTDSVVLATTPVTGNSVPRMLGYNPVTNEIMIFSSFEDSIHAYNINTWAHTGIEAILTGEQHGAYYENGWFYLTNYPGDVYKLNATTYGSDVQVMDTASNSLMDLTRIHMIKSHASSFCANSSMNLVAMYQSPAGYTWYRNGAPIANSNNDTLVVTQAGTYQLLEQLEDSTGFVFSAPTTITALNIPVVSITATNDSICPDSTITLTATAGGTGQWYLNGVAIPGAINNTYAASDTGSYNYFKTNSNGCSDSSATAFVIHADFNCGTVSVSEFTKNVISVYPNPVSDNVMVTASSQMESVVITDQHGRVVMNVSCNSKSTVLETETLASGIYFMQIQTVDGISYEKLLKQ